MAPLFTAYAHKDGSVSSLTLAHCEEIAKGGVGMMVVANASIDEGGSVSKHSLRVDDDRFLPGLSMLADTIKKEDVAAVLQINHGGHFAKGGNTLSPSSVSLSDLDLGGLYKTALKSLDFQQQWSVLSEAIQHPKRSKKMTENDIKYIISAYAQASVRAKKAGFDMVEIHGATGYLPVQFLSPRTNSRKDQYGGSLENRMRFPLELLKAIKRAVGSDFPVGYRFLADEWMDDGFQLDEAKIFAQSLSDLHVAYLSVTAGTYESFSRPEIVEKSHEPGYMVYLAKQIKDVVDVPVITTGRITSPELAEEILREEKSDLIGLARPLFADPQWPKKARKGNEKDILPCKDCGTCFQLVVSDRSALCAQWGKAKLIKRKTMIKEVHNPRKKILIAIDGSENATMGAAYAADMLSNRKDVSITLIHIQTDEIDKDQQGINEMIDIARSLLIKAGIPKKAISVHISKKEVGIARDILREIAEGGYGTVVIGRRGISKAQQFLFGSVSNKILQNTGDYTVWVVE